jgi:D-alanyl-D-alanine carboxypeptidase
VKFIRLILLSFLLFFVSEISYGRHSAIVIDADNGNILHEVDANQPWFPASLTKVMTLYMTFDALKEGQISLHDTLTASWHAASQPNSKLGLRQGEKLTARDAILAVITRSANDAAVVLGEELGGTEENFGAMMTAKAHSLGMSSSRFMNATGLPNGLQVTTSRDLAILAWRIQRDFPAYYQFFSAQSFDYKGTTLRSINAFVKNYPGAEGMKTGFTCGSGYNLMASAHQNGQRLIGVVLGGMTSKERYQLMTQIMDTSFAKRFSDNPSRDIYSIQANSFSPPPYQLGCGSHRAT